jgi:hypothetical protein
MAGRFLLSVDLMLALANAGRWTIGAEMLEKAQPPTIRPSAALRKRLAIAGTTRAMLYGDHRGYEVWPLPR